MQRFLCRLLGGLLALAPVAGHALTVDSIQLLSHGVPSDTAGGRTTPRTLSTADGRYVLFASAAANLVPGQIDANGVNDVFLADRVAATTVLVSHRADSLAAAANTEAEAIALSADGRWALFQSSDATSLVGGATDANGALKDVFLFDRDTGVTSLISRASGSTTVTANFGTQAIAMSPDARWVLLWGSAPNLVAGVTDTNGSADAFVFDRLSGTTTLVSRSAGSATTTRHGR